MTYPAYISTPGDTMELSALESPVTGPQILALDGVPVCSPVYPGVGDGSPQKAPAQDGYVLITTAPIPASTTSTTLVSTAFSANSVPTTSRIVVFEENVDTPTLNNLYQIQLLHLVQVFKQGL